MSGRRIAVIGGGVSGLTAGYVLSRTDRVTLFEAATPTPTRSASIPASSSTTSAPTRC